MCLFCKIIAREIPARIRFENEFALAFDDISPQAPTHVLFIPKVHVKDVLEASEKEGLMGQIFLAVRQFTQEAGLDPEGIRIVTNCGPKAGQTVFHFHLHLLSGRRLSWPPG